MGTESVHDHRTRASDHRHLGSAKSAAGVVAVLFLVAAVTAVAPRLAHSATSKSLELSGVPEQAATALPGKSIVHDIAIETVAPGSEGLELSARLTDDGGIIQRPVTWTVSSSTGEPVFSGDTPIADFAVKPGDYVVDIRYGAVHLDQTVSLVGGTRLIASFVLDAGGIRILPRLEGMGLPPTPSKSLVYALSGAHPGELLVTSTEPGEILRVPAGDYRIESHFAIGNASAVADVKVKPGLMSAVEIDHQAGLARLAFVGAPDATVQWLISDAAGATLPPIEGLTADAVLKPGSYTATAQIGSETLTAKFNITAGEARDIILGN